MLLNSNPKNSANIEPTETYHIPNQQKFHEDFDGLLRFEITAWFKGENPILLRPLLCTRPILAIWLKKWIPLNVIICLNQSSYLKSEKFSKILIKFPLIWYVVSPCRINIGNKFVGLNKAVYFFTPSPLYGSAQ